MKVLRFLKNESGVSIVEVLIAVSVTAGLSLTVAQLMKNSSENVKHNEAKQQNVSLKGLIENNLAVPSACFNTFNALITQTNLAAMVGTGTVPVPNIRNKVGTGTIMYSPTTNLQPLTITNMVLTKYDSAAGTAELVVNSTFRKSATSTVLVKPIKIPISFNINNSNPAAPILNNCSSMAISGSGWMLAGNSGTVDGTDYIGTSDDQPLNFRINNRKSGRMTTPANGGHSFFGYLAGEVNTGTYNSGFGTGALNRNTSGYYNTAVGGDALYSNTNGHSNTAMGVESLRWNNGSENTAIGKQALYNTTWGSQNTAVGAFALMNNTTNSQNNAFGYRALYTATGSQNLALGNEALQIVTGSANTAVGIGAQTKATNAWYNICMGGSCQWNMTTGQKNVAIGVWANSNGVLTGQGNVSLGHQSGYQIAAGSNNIVIGESSGEWVTTESNNILIGKEAGGSAIIGVSNKLAIENNTLFKNAPLIEGSFTSGARFVRINSNFTVSGNATVNGIAYKPGGGSWTSTSDRRLKNNIKDLHGALDKISKLRPVKYDWKNPQGPQKIVHDTGFIAQEVEKIFPEWVGKQEVTGKDLLLLPKGEKAKNITFPFGFDAFVVKAIQELNEQVIKNKAMFQMMHEGLEQKVEANTKAITLLEKEVRALQNENALLRQRLDNIEKMLSNK